MEVSATLREAKISPRKARLVADQVRGLAVDKAFNIVSFSSKKAAAIIKKLLQSVMYNAENNAGADIDDLHIARIFVDEGPTAKRTRPRAKGRADRIFKRTSHITVIVSDATKESK